MRSTGITGRTGYVTPNILHIDIDSLRADHLGCYGYHRRTSPNIDHVAGEGVRFTDCWVSDAPCLPSRTALWSGQVGWRNGVVNHAGARASSRSEGSSRSYHDRVGLHGFTPVLREQGYRTATVSSFADRHSAWHWYAGFADIIDTGERGMETADLITSRALDWLARNGTSTPWYLHVNYWDPHTPYRTPEEYGDPFVHEPLPEWLTEDLLERSRNGCGGHSARDLHGFDPDWAESMREYPRVPLELETFEDVRRFIDGYDTGVAYVDEHIGRVLETLASQGLLDETAIVISADHGENLGELNVWGDHQTADFPTCRVPLIVRWPDLPGGRLDEGLHWALDWAASAIELVGAEVPADWDGRSFAGAFRDGRSVDRDYIVASQGAWTCQRGVRFGRHLLLVTYHDAYKDLPSKLLFDTTDDPHEEHDLAEARPDLVREGLRLLEEFSEEFAPLPDPLETVVAEGGGAHCRGELPAYAEHLRLTDRGELADRLLAAHPADARETVGSMG